MNHFVKRLEYSLGRVSGRSVASMQREAWEGLINRDGQPTFVTSLGGPFAGLMETASVVAVAASGYSNPDPGISVARYDPQDEPYIYNMDQYTVVQTLTLHPQFLDIVRVAGVAASGELHEVMAQYVFVVKRDEDEIPDHWVESLPARILKARLKEFDW